MPDRHSSTHASLVLATLAAACPSAHAQSVLLALDGEPGDRLGTAVASAGDVNGDGFDDVIVGATHDDDGGSNAGSARVVSGRSGVTLHFFVGDSAFDRFGRSVSGAGDVDGDGFDDLVVGAYFDDGNGSNAGSASIFSGRSGDLLYRFAGAAAGDQFGWSVSGAGDVNSDGFDDVIVGADRADGIGADCGAANVYSGANGTLLFSFEGRLPGDHFGECVSGAGDVDGDGHDDVIVGAPGAAPNGPGSGSARVLSGANGLSLYTFTGDDADDRFGTSVSGAGDVNNDGFCDVIVGAYGDDDNGSLAGRARVYSGIDGTVLHTFDGAAAQDHFGFSVAGAGDVNADGSDDLVVGAYRADVNGSDSGSVRVFSGATGATLHTFHGDDAGDRFGTSVSCARNVDGDGHADLIVGAIADEAGGGGDAGSARVFSGAGTLGTSYCGPAAMNSSGLSGVIHATGWRPAVRNEITLHAAQLPPGQFGFFLASQTAGFFMPPGSQGYSCLTGDIGRYNLPGQILTGPEDSVRINLLAVPVNPAQAVLPGETWNFQAWYRDHNPALTSNFTDGLSITFL